MSDRNSSAKPFVIELHEEQSKVVRELREEELERVSGGGSEFSIPTLTVTPDGCMHDD